MDSDRFRKQSWNILNWNIHGLNSDDKRNVIRAKLDESACSIYCLQEPKSQFFDHSTIRKMAPKKFNKFEYVPSDVASGGIIMGWCNTMFIGEVLYKSKFAITVKFTAMHNAEIWALTTVYGPCSGQDRQEFINWLNRLNVDEYCKWMFVGDFNFYMSLEDRNREGGNMQDSMIFNEMISSLGLQEIPLKGVSYTWSNMQENPLLESKLIGVSLLSTGSLTTQTH
jgi:exonuclease III